jgi:2-dehydropantoate 2-reductase
MKNHVYIVGAGAIGKALAVFLQLGGRPVTVLRGSIDDGTPYQEAMTVALERQELKAEVKVDFIKNIRSIDGMVVLTCKSFGNPALAGVLKGRTGDSPIVLLQNGLGVESPFTRQGFQRVYRCVLFVTSQVLGDGKVRFKPVAACPMGTVNGNGRQLSAIVAQLDTPYFRFAAETDIQPVIWKKAIANCVFNSVCPLLEADNGIFQRDAAALAVADRIITECLLVARAKGVLLEHRDVRESLLHISRLSAEQLISTLQDIRQGRRTEIETFNPAIVEMASMLGMGHLVPETRLLGELTKLKSELNRSRQSAGNGVAN